MFLRFILAFALFWVLLALIGFNIELACAMAIFGSLLLLPQIKNLKFPWLDELMM